MKRESNSLLALVLLVALVLALAGASIDHDEREAQSVASADVQQLAADCSAVAGAVEPPPSQAMREAFVDTGEAGPVRLLLSDDVVRPGEGLTLAPLNLSRARISYGLAAGVEDAVTGEPLPGPGSGLTLLLGINAESGEVGACTSIAIPNSAPPGEYLAVLFSVAGDDVPEQDVKAPFTIGGAPLNDAPMMPAGVIPAKGVDRTYPKRVIHAAENRVARALDDEPIAGGWSVGDDLTYRSIDVAVPELSRAAYREILRVSKVPVGFAIG